MNVQHENPKSDRAEVHPPLPPQEQEPPGVESAMKPRPDHGEKSYQGTGRLKDKVAIVTGGDSGIGKAICIAFAREGADVVCAYLNEHEDAKDTKQWVERAGRRCVLVASDLSDEAGCQKVIQVARDQMGVGSDRPLDILVNNAAFQGKAVDDFQEITYDRVLHTFKTNIISMFELTRLALPLFHDNSGGSIINVGSVQAFNPSAPIADYAATKGAIVNFTKSMAPKLMERGIRVNCIAPGPIWTPLVVSSFSNEKIEKFGEKYPAGRPAMPVEVAPSAVFLASKDAQYVSGEVLSVTGGQPL